MKTARLEIRLDPRELELVKRLATHYGTTVSDLMRMLIKAASVSPGEGHPSFLVLNRQTLASYVRNVRALGHLLNQSTHAINAIAKAVRESGVDALDLVEALEGVSWGLEAVRRDVADVRRQAAELTGMPVVFGE